MAVLAAPQAKPAQRSAGKVGAAARASPVLQPKLEVGPSHDRFEAEADRVAASVVSPSGPTTPPAISALPANCAARKSLQRAETHPIEQRERKPDPKVQALGEMIQSKPKPERQEETKKVQSKPKPERKEETQKAQSKPKPGRQDENTKAQTKGLPGQVKPKQEDPVDLLAQSKRLGTVQRDSVDDDTVLETTLPIQTKRQMQRAAERGDSSLDQEEAGNTKPAQRVATSSDGFSAPPSVESGIASLRGRGTSLKSETRNTMEPRFGRDLSGVRIHEGAQSARLADDIHARAFTIGQDVFFGAGQYQPASSDGQALLAHELTHTIQQSGGSNQAQPSRIQPSRIQRNPPGPASGATTGTPASATGSSGSTAAAASPPSPVFNELPRIGKIDVTGGIREVKMENLPLPTISGSPKGTVESSADPTRNALNFSSPWAFKGKAARGPTAARDRWLTAVTANETNIIGKITAKANAANPNAANPNIASDGGRMIYLRSRARGSARAQNFLLIGTATELAASPRLRIPIWNAAGQGTLFDVDHKQELQLGGLDAIENMWLLEESSNRSSGARIKNRIRDEFTQLVTAASTANFFGANTVSTPPVWDEVRAGTTPATGGAWKVTYNRAVGLDIEGTKSVWTLDQVKNGDHLDQQVEALTDAEAMRLGLIYQRNPTRLHANIYSTKNLGGFYRRVDFSNANNVIPVSGEGTGMGNFGSGATGARAGNQLFRGLSVGTGGFTMEPATPAGPVTTGSSSSVRALLGDVDVSALSEDQLIGHVAGLPFTASGEIQPGPFEPLPVKWQRRFGLGGYIDGAGIASRLARLNIHGMSPISIQDAGISAQGEIYAFGEIEATKALFPNLRVPIYLRGNEIGISFPIPTDRLTFGPVRVTEASIDIGIGEHGIFLSGNAALVIDGVGSGTVTARVTREDTILEGEFNFDLSFLDPAQARVRYSFANDTLALTLNAGIRNGVLPGVTGGRFTAGFSREAISIAGSLDLAPPLNGSTLTLGYDRETGLTIAAENLPLPVSNIPGVTDASLSARANYNPDDGSWRLSGEGRANFAVPPATGSLTIALDGPVVTITGTAAFQQGIAAGSLNVTATNAELDANGVAVPGRVARNFTVFGSGSASLTLGILTGTAGLELTRDGHVVITGTIALPPSHSVFDRRPFERELLHVESPDIPIWGFSLGGFGVGVFAFFDAYLKADAFVGPGTLENTQATVIFDLAHPEDAIVDGTASFVVPAGAGLTLDIGGGLRARAAVAFVEGRIGLDARLGLQAEARADVAVHWSRQEGLSLAASAHIEAQPQFEIGVNARIRAGVDLGLFDITKTFGPWREQLGSFGPALAVGATLPIAWSERDGLDFSADNIELTYPDIDFGAILTDSFMELI